MNSISLNRRLFMSSLLLGGATLALSGRAAFAYEVTKSDADWKKQLSPLAYKVLRQAGTEYPFSSPLDKLYA